MGRPHEVLHLVKGSFVCWKIMDIRTSFIRIIIFFDGAFQYDSGSTFWGYVGTNAELLFVKFCNICSIMYLRYLSCYCSVCVTVFSWYDNSIILKPQFNFMVCLSKIFEILEILTRRPKYSRDYIGLQIYLCLEFYHWLRKTGSELNSWTLFV
jgi:hypothetical protein